MSIKRYAYANWYCNRCGSMMLLHEGEGGVVGWRCPRCDVDGDGDE